MVGLGPGDVPASAPIKFVGAGTAACIADLITFPLDTAKVRLQVNNASVTNCGHCYTIDFKLQIKSIVKVCLIIFCLPRVDPGGGQ